jgi:protease IV
MAASAPGGSAPRSGPALRLARSSAASASSLARRLASPLLLPRGRFWLRIALETSVPELAPRMGTLSLRPAGPPLHALLEALASAAADRRVEGVLLRLRGAPVSLAQALALRRAFAALRAAGKPVVVYAEQLGSEELFLAAAASRIFVPEAGSVAPLGLRIETLFLRDLLDRLGVRVEVLRVGEFKSAAEGLVRRGMSEAQRSQLEALVEDLYDVWIDGIAEGRGLAPARVRELVDGAPYRARAAREAGLIDACLFPDELERALAELAGRPAPAGGETSVAVADLAAYLAIRARDPGLRAPFAEIPRIAYVVATGMVRGGSGAAGIASEAYRALLRRLELDPAVRAAVLRIESPGGDGLASDLLWRSVRRLAAVKPVVASLGAVAASGGYYLASAADAILSESATLTGSIGVVGGKLDLAELLRRVGVAREGVERGARAGLLSAARAMTPAERSAVRADLHAVYELFLERVAEGRRMTRDAVHAVARGRVWSGRRALAEGLVDALGGPLEALAEARRRSGIAEGERVRVEVLPGTSPLSGVASWLLRRGTPL